MENPELLHLPCLVRRAAPRFNLSVGGAKQRGRVDALVNIHTDNYRIVTC